MWALLRRTDVRRYLAAQLLSLFGDSAMLLVLSIWVKSLTGSSAKAGLVFFVVLLPSLFAPAAGMLVDRVRRRRLLVVVNLTAVAVVLPLLLVDGVGQLWLIYLVAFGYGVAGSLIVAAQSALLTTMVDPAELGAANGALQTGKELLRLLAPIAGAGLYAWWGGPAPVILLDAATFVAAAALQASLRITEPRPAAPERQWRAELLAGLAFVRGEVTLRRLLLTTAACTCVFGFFETVVYAVADALGRPPSFVGVIVTVQGVGSVAGGATAAKALRSAGAVRLAGTGLGVVAAGMAALTGPLPAVLAGSLVLGVGLPWLVVALVTTVQRATPSALQGRVMSVTDLTLHVPMTVSIAAGAALISVVDYRVLILAAVTVVAAAAGYLLIASGAERAPVPAPAVSP